MDWTRVRDAPICPSTFWKQLSSGSRAFWTHAPLDLPSPPKKKHTHAQTHIQTRRHRQTHAVKSQTHTHTEKTKHHGFKKTQYRRFNSVFTSTLQLFCELIRAQNDAATCCNTRCNTHCIKLQHIKNTQSSTLQHTLLRTHSRTDTTILVHERVYVTWLLDACLDSLRRRALQHPETHCNTLHSTASQVNALQHTATHCNTLQHTTTYCDTLHYPVLHANALQHTATHCSTVQQTILHCNTPQYTATHYNTLQHITILHHNTLPYSSTERLRHRRIATEHSVLQCVLRCVLQCVLRCV